jgi:hypothetical protein
LGTEPDDAGDKNFFLLQNMAHVAHTFCLLGEDDHLFAPHFDVPIAQEEQSQSKIAVQ